MSKIKVRVSHFLVEVYRKTSRIWPGNSPGFNLGLQLRLSIEAVGNRDDSPSNPLYNAVEGFSNYTDDPTFSTPSTPIEYRPQIASQDFRNDFQVSSVTETGNSTLGINITSDYYNIGESQGTQAPSPLTPPFF
jgi:hypothetical protein